MRPINLIDYLRRHHRGLLARVTRLIPFTRNQKWTRAIGGRGRLEATVEPMFANTKFNRRIDRFQRRGRSACRSEWRLITATHNLLKLHRHHTALAAA